MFTDMQTCQNALDEILPKYLLSNYSYECIWANQIILKLNYMDTAY